LLGVFVPLYASHTLADIIGNRSHIWHDFAWFTSLAALTVAGNTLGIRSSVVLQAQVMQDLSDDVFERLLQRSVGFFNNQIGGKLVSDTLDFSSSYGLLFTTLFVNVTGFALTIVIGLTIVAINNWLIGSILLLLMLFLASWTIVEAKKRSGYRARRLKVARALTGHISDTIVNAVTVKTFAREADEMADNAKLTSNLANARILDWQRATTNENLRMGFLLVIQAALLLMLIQLTRNNPHLLATGIFAFTYTLTLINRFFTITTLTRQTEEGFLNASPMTELLSQPIEITDTPDAVPLQVSDGEIALRDVTFHYADAKKSDKVFDGLNLMIKPGQKIGLVGHSGGGKSTLTRLLLRFDDIADGTITIDGQDIKGVTQTSLRQQISYVPQEPLLFHRTIQENIAYGNPAASRQQIEKAAKLAYAHDFIMKLPEGYDTVVGERGVKLSGGQRQRIAIARAILKNAPILVLDEATSALDSESEKAIQKALWELMQDKTAVVVAHRLSTIQRMDRILVLDDGKIIEDGNHDELLKEDGLYAKLWAHQSGGFIEE
jgi:ATP-binding cassette subfamily B protein